jgi:Fic family protein
MSDEAVKTAAIEGEILNRDSVQSSLRHQFGLGPEPPGMPAAERGIAQMMLDLYEHFAAPLNDAVLHGWNEMVLAGGRSVQLAGAYRTHADAMQVVSGPVHRRTVHVEAPPSEAVPAEMRRFIGWFKGGLSAENYITITGTSRATATRDLHDLVEKGALTRTGELRHTHYALKLDLD